MCEKSLPRLQSHTEAEEPPWKKAAAAPGAMRPPEPVEPPGHAAPVPSAAAATGVLGTTTPMMPLQPKMHGVGNVYNQKGSGKGQEYGYWWEDQQGGWRWYQPVTWMHWVLSVQPAVCLRLACLLFIVHAV